jgi:Fe2+ or Zn2+ uptake regulation protein
VLVETFFERDAPLSAQALLEALGRRGQHPNKTTVYREIAKLLSLGFSEPVSLGTRTAYYERTLASRHHHHLVCLNCERVEDVRFPEAGIRREEKKLLASRGFLVARHALEFFGTCNRCQS